MAFKNIGGLWLNKINQIYFGSITTNDSKIPIMITPVIETPPRGPSFIINNHYAENNRVMVKKIGALWAKDKNGKSFLSGKVFEGDNELVIMGFYNSNKTPENNQPDINIVISLKENVEPGGKKDDFENEDPFGSDPF